MNNLLDLADKATRTTLGRNRCWNPEDWEDARQEAAIGIIEAAERGGADDEGYLFNAARNQIYEWMRGWLRHHPRAGTIIDYLDYAQIDNDPYAVEYDFEKLRIMLQFQQSQNPDQDIRYLELRMAGRSTEGIAMELGITTRNVYAIRERLEPRLKRIIRGEDPIPAKPKTVRPSSIAALRSVDRKAATQRAAETRAAKAGRAYTPPPDDINARITEFYNAGATIAECALACHVSQAQAYRLLIASGVQMRPRKKRGK